MFEVAHALKNSVVVLRQDHRLKRLERPPQLNSKPTNHGKRGI
jgi:hypothetical protein